MLIVTIVAIGAQSALASCPEPPDLETGFAEADIVFIGVVVELTNNDRTAKMEIESVWKGPQLPDVVTVHGSPDNPDDPNLFTSVDRTFTFGTYVVFPFNTQPPFRDNICTLTQRTTPALDAINPDAKELIDNGTGVVTTTVAATGDIPPPVPRQQSDVPDPEQVNEGRFPSLALSISLATVLMTIGLFAWWRRSQ
ncbi:MAG: hypothetical protein DRJ28_11190 [Actinobacteria bacterium]|nr:MAG: hypothetical protein DRJ28_11190 [Actinomycetota bacterium]